MDDPVTRGLELALLVQGDYGFVLHEEYGALDDGHCPGDRFADHYTSF